MQPMARCVSGIDFHTGKNIMVFKLPPQSPQIAPLSLPEEKPKAALPDAASIQQKTTTAPVAPRNFQPGSRASNKLRGMLENSGLMDQAKKAAKEVGTQAVAESVSHLADRAGTVATRLMAAPTRQQKLAGVALKGITVVAKGIANDLVSSRRPGKRAQAEKALAQNPGLGNEPVGHNGWTLNNERAAFGPESGFQWPGF
jgi:hypothetical protein